MPLIFEWAGLPQSGQYVYFYPMPGRARSRLFRRPALVVALGILCIVISLAMGKHAYSEGVAWIEMRGSDLPTCDQDFTSGCTTERSAAIVEKASCHRCLNDEAWMFNIAKPTPDRRRTQLPPAEWPPRTRSRHESGPGFHRRSCGDCSAVIRHRLGDGRAPALVSGHVWAARIEHFRRESLGISIRHESRSSGIVVGTHLFEANAKRRLAHLHCRGIWHRSSKPVPEADRGLHRLHGDLGRGAMRHHVRIAPAALSTTSL